MACARMDVWLVKQLQHARTTDCPSMHCSMHSSHVRSVRTRENECSGWQLFNCVVIFQWSQHHAMRSVSPLFLLYVCLCVFAHVCVHVCTFLARFCVDVSGTHTRALCARHGVVFAGAATCIRMQNVYYCGGGKPGGKAYNCQVGANMLLQKITQSVHLCICV